MVSNWDITLSQDNLPIVIGNSLTNIEDLEKDSKCFD